MYGYPITPHTSPLPLSLPLNTMPSPSPAAASEATPSRTPPREVVGAHTIARLVDPGGPAPDLGAGTALFGRDYDAAGGAVSVLARVVANADGAAVKRLRSPSKVGGPPSPSQTPRAKRSNLGRAPPSPLRRSPVRVIAANPPTSADDILKSLAQVYEESIQREVDEQDTEEGNDVTTASPESTHTSSRKIKKRTKHPKMHEDIFAAGRELLMKKDHLAVRSNAQRRRAKKGALRRCILNSITDRQRRVVIAAVGMEVATRPAWQQRLRSCENNLKLT